MSINGQLYISVSRNDSFTNNKIKEQTRRILYDNNIINVGYSQLIETFSAEIDQEACLQLNELLGKSLLSHQN